MLLEFEVFESIKNTETIITSNVHISPIYELTPMRLSLNGKYISINNNWIVLNIILRPCCI